MFDFTTLFSEIDKIEEKYIKTWAEFCNIESPTDCKEGVDKAAHYLETAAAEIGLDTKITALEKAGDLLTVTLDNRSQKKPIVVSAHIDTVHPVGSFGTPAVRIENGEIHGPGVLDDKGGAIAAMYAIEALKNSGYKERNVIFIAQTDEEVGSTISNKETIKYICDVAKDSEAFINCEQLHGGKAILIRKGIARYKFKITGKAVHASGCHNGKSALTEAAHKIIEIEKFKNPDGITCSCSLMSAGESANSVPKQAEFSVDVRFFTKEQFVTVDTALREIAANSYIGGTECEIIPVSTRPAMELTETNLKFLEKINKIYANNGMETLEVGTSLGGSDATYVSALGIPTVDSIGCAGKNIHTREEFAYLRSMKESAKRIASIIYFYDKF